MAQSLFATQNYPTPDFVESCGASLFDLSNSEEKKVCLLHHKAKNEWLLAKGRRNIRESRKDAALREVIEETGYRCHLHPVTMTTRATPVDEAVDLPDKPRDYAGLTEPFMFTIREIRGKDNVKIIWWFIAVLDDGAITDRLPGEPDYQPEFFPCSQAVDTLTFETDREVLRKAIELINAT